jgi:hypothetical protein
MNIHYENIANYFIDSRTLIAASDMPVSLLICIDYLDAR